MLRMTLCLALASLVAAPAAAQTARINGSITDETGAVLPAVEVRAMLRDDAGETTRSVVTNAKGEYTLDSLAPGAWVLTASVPGFETGTRRATVQAGDALDWSPTLQVGMIQETVSVTTAASNEPLRYESPRTTDVAPALRPAVPGAVRVGGSIKPPRKIVHVRPVYPADAAAHGVSGVVVLSAIIGSDGQVREVKAVRSANDALTLAATNALTGWEFTPTLLNGLPIDTRMTATFNFQQQQ